MIGIYKITNRINNKCYIGKSVNIESRLDQHRNNYHSNIYLQNAIKKYGIENFIFEVIEECSENLLNEKEIYWIKYYGSFGKDGYNLTEGGDGGNFKYYTYEQRSRVLKGHKVSKETRIKIGKFHKGKHLSEETRRKISESNKGHIPWNKGKQYSDDVLESIREGQRKRRERERIENIHYYHTEETKTKISESRKGIIFTDDHKKHISDSIKNRGGMSGDRNPFYGKHHSEETRKILSDKSKQRHVPCSDSKKEVLRKSALGRKYINNGSDVKAVKECDLSDYLSNGWILGRKIIRDE